MWDKEVGMRICSLVPSGQRKRKKEYGRESLEPGELTRSQCGRIAK